MSEFPHPDKAVADLRRGLLDRMKALAALGYGPEGVAEILWRTQAAQIEIALCGTKWSPSFVKVTLRGYGFRERGPAVISGDGMSRYPGGTGLRWTESGVFEPGQWVKSRRGRVRWVKRKTPYRCRPSQRALAVALDLPAHA